MSSLPVHGDALSSAAAVWMVVLDRMPSNDACNALDLTSTYFEQFFLQDVRNRVDASAMFGGEAAIRQLAKLLSASDQSASLVTLIPDSSSPNSSVDVAPARDHLVSIMHRCEMPLLATVDECWHGDEASRPTASGSDEFMRALSAKFVWIEVLIGTTADREDGAAGILHFLQKLILSGAAQQDVPPVLIVTSRAGEDCEARNPFNAAIEESRIHVPLWIRHGADHACRVQALAGSFDLLPTVAEFLGHGQSDFDVETNQKPNRAVEDAADADTATAPPELSAAPLSLVRLCGAPQVCPDRLLRIQGDGWKAGRTERFLLVTSAQQKPESDDYDSGEPSRRLFVKPDDRFNVSDVSGTWVAVADELLALLD